MAASDQTLRRIVINKEVVLLRQAVRKARICLVSKLTREAKKLRSKRGDEKQLEKNKRKADKLGREVTALKPVKDDEISQYGIINLDKLQEISHDPTVSDLIRVTAKVGIQKTLLPKLQEFREKFPDFEEYVSTKKKKTKAKEKKPAKEVDGKVTRPKEPKRVPPIQPDEEDNETSNSADDLNETNNDNAEESNSDANVDSSESEIDNDNEPASLPIAIESKVSKKDVTNEVPSSESETDNENKPASLPTAIETNAKISKVSKKDIVTKKVLNPEGETDKQKKPASLPTAKKSKVNKKDVVKEAASPKVVPKEQTPKPVKVINKVASVKRFTEVLEEENENNTISDLVGIHTENENNEIEKEVDDFFMSGDNNGVHFVVASKPIVQDNETEWDNQDRYFNKNSQRRHKEKPFNNDKRWDSGPKRNQKWDDTDRQSQKPHWGSQNQDFRKGNTEPEKKKLRRNEEGTNVIVPEHLHPSWEAKRKQQEILKQGFQGKKIVFGDD